MTRAGVRLAAAAIVVVPLVGYPAMVLVDGGPRFPSAEDCVHLAAPGESERPRPRVRPPGHAGRRRSSCSPKSSTSATSTPRCEEDGCLRWKVLYKGITSYAQGASSAAEARRAGLDARLEIQPP